MRNLVFFGALAGAILCGDHFSAANGLAPLGTFGGGDGWLAPGDRTYLTTDNTQRGLAYNPVTGNLLLVSRNDGLSIRILNGASGVDAGTLSTTGISSGGTIFPLNMIAVADDGVIYSTSLSDTGLQQLRVYSWASETSDPSGAYSGQPNVGFAPRLGDTLDVRGSGPDTLLLLGVGSGLAGSPANNGYMFFTTAGGAPYSVLPRPFDSTPPEENDHRLGITFGPGDTVIGTRGGLNNVSAPQPATYSSFDDASANYINSIYLTSTGERPMDFAEIDGVPVLATVDTVTSIVRVYDLTVPDAPELIGELTNIAAVSNPNANGVGQVRFGAISEHSATLYALNTNNGIQAFTVTVPEPSAMALLAISALCLRRR